MQHTTTQPAGDKPRRSPRAAIILVAVVALTGAVLAGGIAAGDDHEHEAISVRMLTERSSYPDDVAIQIRNKFDGHGRDVMNLRDASNIAVAEITIQPGAVFPWHTHPGPVLITIADGEQDSDAFVYILADDCVERRYGAGEALIDAGGDNVHTAYNPSETEETVVIATFLATPDEGPLTVPAEGPDPDECALPSP